MNESRPSTCLGVQIRLGERHRRGVNSRLQESFKIKERYHAIVAVEAFNLFNHSNYGNFDTTASIGTGANAYGTPLAVTGNPVEYFARSRKFIGRFSF